MTSKKKTIIIVGITFSLMIICFISIRVYNNYITKGFKEELNSFQNAYLDLTASYEQENDAEKIIRALSNNESIGKWENLKEIQLSLELQAKTYNERQIIERTNKYVECLEKLRNRENDNSNFLIMEWCRSNIKKNQKNNTYLF